MLKSSRRPLSVIYSLHHHHHHLRNAASSRRTAGSIFEQNVPCAATSIIDNSSRRSLSTDSKTLPPRRLDPLDLTFRDTKQAYKSKTTYELLRAIFVLKISQFDYLVYNNAMVRERD